MNINDLNNKFATAGRIAFRQSHEGLPEMVLVNGYGSCEISLYGGQVLNYRPMGHTPALFISQESIRKEGEQIRGGIPLCWPWLGTPPAENLPRHGFARLMTWEVLSTSYDSKSSEVTLGIAATEETYKLWPYRFELIQKITLSDNLSIEVTTVNRDSKPFEISQSIHPYFKIRDITNVSIAGLEDIEYTDFFSKERHTQKSPLNIDKETFYIYEAEDQSCALCDNGMGRNILIASSGMNKIIVWNPWAEKAKELKDLGDDEYRKMITIAPAHTADTPLTIAPGERNTIKTAIQVVLA